MRIFLLMLLFYPFAEIAALVALADHIGGMATLLLVVCSSLLGMWMLRNQKLGALLTLGSLMRQGDRVSVYSLLWPLRYALAGVFFLVPGVISDLFAVLLLLPFKGPEIAVNRGPAAPGHAAGDDVIEGEYSRVDDAAPPGNRLH
ncbi:membrane protein FxsA [Xenophilus sp. AP218F]|nr:FxsA family protein [Chromobacterium sp. ASV5]OWY40813.1 membrane protein FxsA [Xenophilus sp. AP218F]